MNQNNNMDRQLKFRVWDKHKNIFMYSGNNNDVLVDTFVFDLNGNLYINNGLSYDRTEYYKCDKEYFAIQQFTGLLDKNGKEIYEGDICNISFSTMNNRGIVSIENGHTWCSNIALWQHYSVEVIGNIYENPKLLKQ